MAKSDKRDAPRLESLKYSGVVLVCGQCEERGSGPKKLKARDIRKSLRQNLGDARFKTRVLECSCLGLCPKKAMALAALHAGAKPVVAVIRSEDDAIAFASTVAQAAR